MIQETMPSIDAWDITPSPYNTLTYRRFKAVPKERLILDYNTFERYRRQVIKVVEAVEVIEAEMTYSWDERNEEWKETITMQIFLLNPQTMNRYSFRNPLSERISTHDEGVPMSEAIREVLRTATKPSTRIVITEVPQADV